MKNNYLDNVREIKPLVHNITNYVTVNDVANAILAIGASPIMSDEPEDVEDITSICQALNINIGTLHKNSINGMLKAGKKANELGHPVVLDPVGAGASKLRTQTAQGILDNINLDLIKGNISEIKSLALNEGSTKGVDANISDSVTEENLDEVIKWLKDFSKKTDTILAATGAIDLVTDGEKCFIIRNGRPEMSQITGTGCQLSGLIAAFLAANPKNKLEAAAIAIALMGLAGEIGFKNLQENEGNASYRNRIIDALYNMNSETLNEGIKIESR